MLLQQQQQQQQMQQQQMLLEQQQQQSSQIAQGSPDEGQERMEWVRRKARGEESVITEETEGEEAALSCAVITRGLNYGEYWWLKWTLDNPSNTHTVP